MVNRCRWVPTNNKLYCDYHDKEWGKPIGDDQKLFELLCIIYQGLSVKEMPKIMGQGAKFILDF